MSLSRILQLLLGSVLVVSSATAAELRYPARPIRFIVAFPPGGGADTVARIMAQKLSDVWREQVVVDNRSGAGGNIAPIITSKAAPDGYTLLQSTVGHAISASLELRPQYDLARDFVAVTELASTPFMLVSSPSFPAQSLAELMALVKAKPNALTYASSGIGGPSHLAMELFKGATRLEMRHVPYKGAVPSLTDLMAGQVDMTFTAISPALPLIKAGKIRAIGVGSLKRTTSAPSVPTIDESGVKGFEAGTWYGVNAPAGTSPAIVAALYTELSRILRQPDIIDRLSANGFDVVASKPDEFTAYVRSEIAKWASAVKNSGMRIE